MKTKAYHWFKQRCDYHNAGLELCELLVRRFTEMEDGSGTVAEALGGDVADHPYLGRRRNTAQSRAVLGGHLRRTQYGSFFKDVHEDLYTFCSPR